MTGTLMGLALNGLLFEFPMTLLDVLFKFRVVEIGAFAAAVDPKPDPSPPLYTFPPATP